MINVFADFTAAVERVVHQLVCGRCDCHRCSVLSRFRGLFPNLPAAACFRALSLGRHRRGDGRLAFVRNLDVDGPAVIDLTCLQFALALQQLRT